MPIERGKAALGRDSRREVRLTIDIDVDLHKDLKMFCAEHRTSIREVLWYLLKYDLRNVQADKLTTYKSVDDLLHVQD